MKNYARKLSVGILILNNVSPPGVGKTFRIQFLVNESNSMHYYEKFRLEIFFRKFNFEQMCHHQDSKNPSKISFWWISWELCTFMKNFARKFFVENLILNRCVKMSPGVEKPFRIQFLVKDFYALFQEIW